MYWGGHYTTPERPREQWTRSGLYLNHPTSAIVAIPLGECLRGNTGPTPEPPLIIAGFLMSHTFCRLILPFAWLHVVAASAAEPAPSIVAAEPTISWTNPIIPKRADPHVILHSDGYYYLTATVPEYDRIELRRARTLAGLSDAEPKIIWRKHPHGPMGAHIWAPELHFIDGKWYLYFTAGEAESIWAIRPYVLEGAGENPLEAAWIEKGKIKLGWDSFSLDATTFVHRGARYYVWAQDEKGVKGSNIYIARMDTPLSITGPVTRLTKPEYNWEKRRHWVCEAPAVLVKNGRVWMTYSASATDANYCLGLLVADENADLLDAASWKKQPLPVLASYEPASQFGTGHNSFTTTPDGKTDILVYHSRNYRKIEGEPLYNPDRATRAHVLRWAPDGSPVFDVPPADGPVILP